jgi:tetratricopeptide (TPR) repeat protein
LKNILFIFCFLSLLSCFTVCGNSSPDKIKEKIKQDKNDNAQLLQKVGMNYVEENDYKRANKCLLQALEKNKDTKEKSFYWCGLTYLYLARNARYHNKWKEAEKYYEKAAEILEKSLIEQEYKTELAQSEKENFVALCIVYKWLQVCFIRNDNVYKVLPLYPKIQKLKQTNKNSIYFVDIYPILVGSYTELEKYKQASELITEGLKMYNSLPKTQKVKSSIASLWWSKAKILHLTGKSKQAFKIGSKAYAVLKKTYSDDPEAIALITKMLEDMRTETPFSSK